MEKSKRRLIATIIVCAVFIALFIVAGVTQGPAAEEGQSRFYKTFWSLLPPIIAIALALITKEVYTSLFVGIIAGALL